MEERYIPVRQQLWQEPVFSQDEGEHLAPTRHQVDVWKAEASNFPATLNELPYGRRDWVDVVATRAFQAGWASATALLEQRHLAPALIAERSWEREGWCDEQGWCWFCNSYSMGQWSYSLPPSPGQDWGRLGTMTHSLPHWAIPRPRPLPQQETTNG